MFSFFKGNPGDNVSCGDKRVILMPQIWRFWIFLLIEINVFFGLPGIKVGFCSRQEERRQKCYTRNLKKKTRKKWIYLEDVHWGTPGVELTRRQSWQMMSLRQMGRRLVTETYTIGIPSIWDTLTTDSYHRTVLGLQIR